MWCRFKSWCCEFLKHVEDVCFVFFVFFFKAAKICWNSVKWCSWAAARAVLAMRLLLFDTTIVAAAGSRRGTWRGGGGWWWAIVVVIIASSLFGPRLFALPRKSQFLEQRDAFFWNVTRFTILVFLVLTTLVVHPRSAVNQWRKMNRKIMWVVAVLGL